VRWTRTSACTGNYAASLGEVALPVAELAWGVASLTSLATGMGLDLNTFNLLETTIFEALGQQPLGR
jgi:hypothetical protein